MTRELHLLLLMAALALVSGCQASVGTSLTEAPLYPGNVYGYGHPPLQQEPLYKTGYAAGYADGRAAPAEQPKNSDCCDVTKKRPLWPY
jgi:hypothetical protein